MNFFKGSTGPAYGTHTRSAISMIRPYDQRVEEWSSPPVDDIGYLPSAELLTMNARELLLLVEAMTDNRYNGWRNHENRWRDVFGLDTTYEKNVLDYGCGVGVEALQYALSGNDVTVADISRDNVRLALRVLRLNGFEPGGFHIVPAMLIPTIFQPFDVIHCCGVLHHIPEPRPVMEAFAKALKDDGEVRLMVYSDEAWRIATSTEPPRGYVEDHPLFETYWQHWDPIGGYADWYDQMRLEQRFGNLFEIARYEPLTENGAYVGVVLTKK